MRFIAAAFALLMLAIPAQAQWYFDGKDKPYPKPIQTPGGVYFNMGTSFPVEASYLLRRNGRIAPNATIRITYQIEVLSGTPDFVAMECNNKPDSGTVGVMLRRSTNASAKREHDRFWYQGVRLNLDPGTYTIVAPLADAARWSGVFGKTAAAYPSKFTGLLNNVRDIALTFGGCSHSGHGVRVYGGNARFTILNVTIQ
jgi:hypothetical protein